MLVFKENEQLKIENRMLRDKVTLLDQEINLINAQRVPEGEHRAMRDEIDRLNQMLHDKDALTDKQMNDQKNEWAEIYGAQKTQSDQMTREITVLNQENEKLVKKVEALERGKGGNVGLELADTAKRLKKRELEC